MIPKYNIIISVHLTLVSVFVRNRDIINKDNLVVSSASTNSVLQSAFYSVLAIMFADKTKDNALFFIEDTDAKSKIVAHFVADALKILGMNIRVKCVGAHTSMAMAQLIIDKLHPHTKMQRFETETVTKSLKHAVTDSRVDVVMDAMWELKDYSSVPLTWYKIYTTRTPCYAFM